MLGRHSGRHAVQRRCDELGLGVAPAELDAVYRAVIDLGERRKPIGDADLRHIVERLRATREPGAAHADAVGYGHGV